MTTHFYVDFDGVINAVSRKPSQDNPTWSPEAWYGFMANGYKISFNAEVIEAIKKLESEPDNVFHWLTTWCSYAPTLLSPRLGVGRNWPVVGEYFYDHQGVTRAWWKETAIREHISLTQPDKVVWIDDDFGYYYAQSDSALLSAAGILRVRPETVAGLEKHHFDSITKFLGTKA